MHLALTGVFVSLPSCDKPAATRRLSSDWDRFCCTLILDHVAWSLVILRWRKETFHCSAYCELHWKGCPGVIGCHPFVEHGSLPRSPNASWTSTWDQAHWLPGPWTLQRGLYMIPSPQEMSSTMPRSAIVGVLPQMPGPSSKQQGAISNR